MAHSIESWCAVRLRQNFNLKKTTAMKDFNDFVRECYLNSTPSVNLTTTGDPVDCRAHKLSVTKYEELQAKLCEVLRGKVPEQDIRMATNMWCLQSGPQLVEE